MIAEPIRDYDITLDITLVRSADNKADGLTRVPQKWLKRKEVPISVASCVNTSDEVQDLSGEICHMHEVHNWVSKECCILPKRDLEMMLQVKLSKK